MVILSVKILQIFKPQLEGLILDVVSRRGSGLVAGGSGLSEGRSRILGGFELGSGGGGFESGTSVVVGLGTKFGTCAGVEVVGGAGVDVIGGATGFGVGGAIGVVDASGVGLGLVVEGSRGSHVGETIELGFGIVGEGIRLGITGERIGLGHAEEGIGIGLAVGNGSGIRLAAREVYWDWDDC